MKRISLFCRMICISMTLALVSCEVVDNVAKSSEGEGDTTYVDLEKVAGILAAVPLMQTHLDEVHDAVSSSSGNGYDEEYTMRHLFGNPGAGVGDKDVRSGSEYTDPLWKLIDRHVRSIAATKASGIDDPDMFLKMLTESDVQIYWPYSEQWNGKDMPVITFDPEDGARTNTGYRIKVEHDGSRHVEKVVVDEATAMEVPVWVVNRNTDSGYTSLEMLRREDPAWGEGGGAIIINPSKDRTSQVKSGSGMKTLVLKEFTMNRNYDSWFAGASEFFVKIGYLDNFTASTEAEMRLYNPMVTDFMIVVKRNQVGVPQPFNAILVTDWSDQVESCAFMITEDDGGTQTEWTSKAKVFVAGKSYGVEITIPLNIRDDVVWRGQLASRWFEESKDEAWPFGDVELTFDIL
ncbi:MAG: hypothetical protein IJ954_01225 [Bacteroidales bacterium]|nr:hypothetical protein [Bacteroidales bacterium]